LNIETTQLEDHQVKLTVEIEADSLEQAKRRAARRLSKHTKIPGFRPGKAPYNIILRHVGEETVLEEGLELLVKDLYPKIIEEAEIRPQGPGKFENIASMDPLKLEFIVPLAAEVELGDFRSIRFPYELDPVGDDEVNRVIENLRNRQAIEEPVERPAQESDHVYLKLSAERSNPGEGEKATLIDNQSFSVIIPPAEEETDGEWPFPGFSRQLIGVKSEDQKTIQYTFPEDTNFESLKGVTANFTAQVEDVKSRTLPKLDDEFAQSVGEYETLEDLRKDARQTLEKQALDAYNDEYNEKIITALLEDATIKYPPQMLEEEIDEVIHQLEHRLHDQNLDLETYMKTQNLDEEGLREEVKPTAEDRLRRSLILLEVAKAEDIQVEKEDLQAETERTLGAMASYMKESDLKRLSNQGLVSNLVGNIMAEMRIEGTLDRLRSIAKGEIESTEEEVVISSEETSSDDSASKQTESPEDTSREDTFEPNIAPEDETEANQETPNKEEPPTPEKEETVDE
jgi:trigger factor